MSGRLRMVLLPAGLVAGLLAEWPTWLARPDWGTVVDLGVGWAFLAAGFMAWSRRPANRVGPLLTAIGFSWFLYNLIFTRNPVAFGIGFWLGSLFIALLVHLVLAFPSGHLSFRGERIFVGGAYAIVVGLSLLLAFTLNPSDYPDCGTGPGLELVPPCPTNALLLYNSKRAYELLDTVNAAFGVMVSAGAALIFFRRWRRATAPARRVLTPVLLTGSISAFLFLVVNAATLRDAPASVANAVYWLSQLGILAVAFSMLFGLLRSHLAHSGVSDLVIDLGGPPRGSYGA